MASSPPVSLVTALAPLVGAKVQKLVVAEDGRVHIELFSGNKQVLGLDPRPPSPRPVLGPQALSREGSPPRSQAVLRKELVPSRLTHLELRAERGLFVFFFERPDGGGRVLYLELSRHEPRLVLTGTYEEAERVLAVLGPSRPGDGRDLRRGRAWEAPRAPGPLPSLEDNVEGVASAHAAERRADGALATLRARIKAEHKRLTRLVSALMRDLERHGDPAVLAESGELLKTVMGRLPRGAARVELTDFEGNPRLVELDPALSPKGNLDRLFHRARRAREGRARVLPRLVAAEAQREAVQRAREALLATDPDAEARTNAASLLEEERAAASPRRLAAREGQRRAWRSFRVSHDTVAKVGRSAKDNDELTLHHAKGNDLWLHARGASGAHVVVPAGREGEVPPEVLLDAAHLAAWFSPLRKQGTADIQYTQRKHLKKPGKGAPAGLVLVGKEKVLHLKVEQARVKRLLEAETASS
jgi:hypothetical protein